MVILPELLDLVARNLAAKAELVESKCAGNGPAAMGGAPPETKEAGL